jgi:hypothetical protein
MSYTLHKLAPGSYDLCKDHELVGSVVRRDQRSLTWIAEVITEESSSKALPRPFTKPEHRFPSFDAMLEWLGGAEVHGDPDDEVCPMPESGDHLTG